MTKNLVQRAISNRRDDMAFIRNLPVRKIEQVYFAIAAIMHLPIFWMHPANEDFSKHLGGSIVCSMQKWKDEQHCL